MQSTVQIRIARVEIIKSANITYSIMLMILKFKAIHKNLLRIEKYE